MKISCIDNIKKIVTECGEINFIAEAISPWHAIGVDSAIEYLKDNGIELKGIVFIVPHSVRGVLIDKSNFNCSKYAGIEFIVVENIVKQSVSFKLFMRYFFTDVKKDSKRLFTITPYSIDFGLNLMVSSLYREKEIISIIIDEGAANYIENKMSWIKGAIKNKGNINSLKKCCIFVKRYISYTKNEILSSLVHKNNKVIDFTVFNVESKPLEINRNAIDYYKKANVMEIVSSCDYKKYKDSIVILTQIIDRCDDENAGDIKPLKVICSELKRNGFENIILKIHPREKNPDRFKCLNVDIDENNQSFERIISNEECKPKAVISYYSTALVNCNIFFGIDTISIYNFLDKKYFGDRDYILTEKFYNAFSNYVMFPKNIDELVDCLKNN